MPVSLHNQNQKITVSLNEETIRRIDLLNHDPFFDRPRKGSRSAFIEAAVLRHLELMEEKSNKI